MVATTLVLALHFNKSCIIQNCWHNVSTFYFESECNGSITPNGRTHITPYKQILYRLVCRSTLPLTKKFWSCHSFVRLLPNRDLPDLTREFFNKEGLYLALSAAKPMLFERYKYLVSSHWAFNCEIPDKRRYLQKMNWFLPYKCLFCQPYFFSCISWIFFAKGIVDSVVEAEHLFKKNLRQQQLTSQRKIDRQLTKKR